MMQIFDFGNNIVNHVCQGISWESKDRQREKERKIVRERERGRERERERSC